MKPAVGGGQPSADADRTAPETPVSTGFGTPRSLEKTSEGWHEDCDGNQIYNSPNETGAKLDAKQGKVYGFLGTCGLVSAENLLRLAGLDVTEDDVVRLAAKRHLCTSHRDPLSNGGTTAVERNEVLKRFGLETVDIPATPYEVARYVEQGRGVILSVNADKLYYGVSFNGALHAITVTSVKRSPNGELLGFYICDSNGEPSKYYPWYDIRDAMSGRNINVTTSIIR